MRCAFVFDGLTCPNQPADGRRLTLSKGNEVEVLLCPPHAQAFDAIQWAKTKKGEM